MSTESQNKGGSNEEFKTYIEIVWRQFKGYDLAYASLFVLGFLVFLALICPVLALDVPFYMYVPPEMAEEELRTVLPSTVAAEQVQGVTFPWFRSLFNTLTFDSGIDLFFNMLLFTLPLNFLLWSVAKRVAETPSKREYMNFRAAFIAISAGIQAILYVTIFFFTPSYRELMFVLAVSGTVTAAIWGYQQYSRSFPSAEERAAFTRRFVLVAVLFHVAGIAGLLVPELSQQSLPYKHMARELDGIRTIFPPIPFSHWWDAGASLADPSWLHPLGTNRTGQDVFTQLLYGTRISLTVGFIAQGLATVIGVGMGALAGYFGGKVDMVILRIIEVFYTFPALFVIMTLTGFVDQPSIVYVMLIIAIVAWTRVARLVRGEFLRLRNEEFVQAAQALGLPKGRIILRHILPNALGPVLVYIAFGIAGAILFEAIVSFLGVGDMTVPSWGQLLRAGDQTRETILIFAPGIALFITITSMYLVGEGIQDAMDPKLRD